MANLNFQQPPRIPSASLNRNTNSSFGSSSISGNVTPTSSLMFQSQQQQQQQQAVNNSNFAVTAAQSQQNPQNQQLSPNRGQLAAIGGQLGPMSANRRLYGNPSLQQQRDDFGSRQMTGGLGGSMNMGSFMSSVRYRSQSSTSGGINNFFASSSETPPFLDMSEFPSLTNARQNDQHSNVMQAPGSKPYGELFHTYSVHYSI
jgi:CCR4-NOT transcription complex subunit 2